MHSRFLKEGARLLQIYLALGVLVSHPESCSSVSLVDIVTPSVRSQGWSPTRALEPSQPCTLRGYHRRV